MISRRNLLRCMGVACFAPGSLMGIGPHNAAVGAARLKTRGVVIYPEDLSLDWPVLAARAGLSTIALHHGSSPSHVIDFVESESGQKFLQKCRANKLEVEYELHAMREMLPRELFDRSPDLFRMNEKGDRTADANLCVSSRTALDIAAEKARAIGRQLRPTTGRYFLWGDDGAAWCRCPKCREYTDSDQALILENHLVTELRRDDPRASLAHLAYANTIQPPKQVRPHSGIFLEFAPIHRRYDVPYSAQGGAVDSLDMLDANLELFARATAQALEYWLDMSRFSGWRRPVPVIPWKRDVFLSDVGEYRRRGICNVTSFAAWIDAEYARNHPDLSFLQQYGSGLDGQN